LRKFTNNLKSELEDHEKERQAMTEDEKLDYIKDILLTPRKDRKHGEFRFIETYFENYHYF